MRNFGTSGLESKYYEKKSLALLFSLIGKLMISLQGIHTKYPTVIVGLIALVIYSILTYAGILEQIYTQHPTAIVGAVALIVASIGILKQRQTSKEKNSLDFEASYKNNADIREAWYTLRIALEQPDGYLLKVAKDKNNKYRKPIILILNEWERAANAIYHELYDEEFLYRAYGSIVIKLFIDTLPFIAHFQLNNPRVFISFTKLAVRWQLKRSDENDFRVLNNLTVSLRDLHSASINLNLSLQESSSKNKPHYLLSRRHSDLKARKLEFKKLFRKVK